MMRTGRKLIATVLSLLMLVSGGVLPVRAAGAEAPVGEPMAAPRQEQAGEGAFRLNCKSAVLMEAETGKILFEQLPNERLNPASVTKIMTLLLIMEGIDSGVIRMDDPVTVSANAASMGGSQVFLKEGETMALEDLLKCVVIASANDAAVALAEHLCGSVSVFVDKMNAKARQLGMENTCFENVTGLDDTAQQHLTSARDIALMSRELIRHKTILKYSSIWMDSIRNGAFGLTNTNRLVRFYPGCTGLKTGSTSKAGFCVSVTAQRGDLSLICVIMGAESRDVRNAEATKLLDWGFANYGVYKLGAAACNPVSVRGGVAPVCDSEHGEFFAVLPKADAARVEIRPEIPETLSAPVRGGDQIGKMSFYVGETCIGSTPILASKAVEKIGFFEILSRMAASFLLI